MPNNKKTNQIVWIITSPLNTKMSFLRNEIVSYLSVQRFGFFVSDNVDVLEAVVVNE